MLFRRMDTDASGDIDFEEFSSVAGATLAAAGMHLNANSLSSLIAEEMAGFSSKAPRRQSTDIIGWQVGNNKYAKYP